MLPDESGAGKESTGVGNSDVKVHRWFDEATAT